MNFTLRSKLTLDTGKLRMEPTHGDIVFSVGGLEIISLKNNGDILVKGKLIENDKEVVDGMRELLGLDKRVRGEE